MKDQLLYKNLAKYYDLIYHFKDYKKESAQIDTLIKQYKKSKGKKLLDVACGSGKHLQYFAKKYSCTGTDVNKSILNEAKKRLKGVKFKQGSMINSKFNEKFDVITCLFSSIGYVKTYDNLKKTLKNFYDHLNKGGIVLIEPWFSKDQLIKNHTSLQTYEDKLVQIARMTNMAINNNISTMNMHYLIGEHGKIHSFKEKHEMGLFDKNKTLDLMKEVGFSAKYLSKKIGRGIFIGVKK